MIEINAFPSAMDDLKTGGHGRVENSLLMAGQRYDHAKALRVVKKLNKLQLHPEITFFADFRPEAEIAGEDQFITMRTGNLSLPSSDGVPRHNFPHLFNKNNGKNGTERLAMEAMYALIHKLYDYKILISLEPEYPNYTIGHTSTEFWSTHFFNEDFLDLAISKMQHLSLIHI